MRRIEHWIDGQVTAGASGRNGIVWNPANGDQQAEVALADAKDVNKAVEAARTAWPQWQAMSLSRRSRIMFRFRELLETNRQNLAEIVTAEHGKTISDALGEVSRGLENVEFACGIPHLLKGEYSQQAATGVDVFSLRQPLGVVVGITPFNFPAMVPLWMLSNALACGNTFVLKPSEKDPSTAMRLAEILAEAGLPSGVFNVVNGDRAAVEHLLGHPDIAAVSFVGSTPVARHVYVTATAAGKRVQALGGAKNHMVVLPDADVNMAADAAISAGFGSAGERCMAISVVVAVGDVAQPLVGAIAQKLPKLIVGPGDDPVSEMGPLVTQEHRDRVSSYIGAGEASGATVVMDGRRANFPPKGFFLGATLLDNVTPDMEVYREEIFGPVLCVVRVANYDEALRLVNDNRYGNGAAIFTRDGGAARRFQSDCTVGMVGINVPIPVPVAYYSFGGWKDSIFGDSNMYGSEGIRFYTRSKVITARWPDPATSVIDLGFPRSY